GAPPPPPPPGGAGPPGPSPPLGAANAKANTNAKENQKVESPYKPLFWKKLHPQQDTFWSNLGLGNEVDSTQVQKEFLKAQTKTKDITVAASVAPKTITVLDGKRAQTVGIALAKLPNVNTVGQYIHDMNDKELDRDTVKRLLDILATNEEIAAMKVYYTSTACVHSKGQEVCCRAYTQTSITSQSVGTMYSHVFVLCTYIL
ncbi:hypothetical protein SARC_10111, partial [Sphaeroforma arctica JP610]